MKGAVRFAETAQRRPAARREMAWRCPRCGRIFRHHVISATTPASGPLCNACGVHLMWAEIEVASEDKEEKEARHGPPVHAG